MRLFFRLMRGYFPNERKYRGKKRQPFPVDKLDEARLVRDIQREERNMFVLRHPYLTVEQSKHLFDFNHKVKSIIFFKEARANFIRRPDTRIEDNLGHLRHGDSWEK